MKNFVGFGQFFMRERMKGKKRKEEMGKRKNKNEFWLPKVSQMRILLKLCQLVGGYALYILLINLVFE
jgi:hypothetical protein